MAEKKAKKDKDKSTKKDAAKQIKRLRKQVGELTETVSHLYRDLDKAIGQISELHARWGSGSLRVVPGEYMVDGHRFPAEDSTATVDPWKMPKTFENLGTGEAREGVIGWDPVEGRPIQVRDIVMGSERPANEYTFWFTQEMCEKLGIPDIQRHLVESGREGRLHMEDGPPVELSPEHRELVRNVVGEGLEPRTDAEAMDRVRDAMNQEEEGQK